MSTSATPWSCRCHSTLSIAFASASNSCWVPRWLAASRRSSCCTLSSDAAGDGEGAWPAARSGASASTLAAYVPGDAVDDRRQRDAGRGLPRPARAGVELVAACRAEVEQVEQHAVREGVVQVDEAILGRRAAQLDDGLRGDGARNQRGD